MSPSNVSSLTSKTLVKDEDIVHANSNVGQAKFLKEKEQASLVLILSKLGFCQLADKGKPLVVPYSIRA